MTLQKPSDMSGRGLGFDNLQTELGGSLLEQVDLLVAVSFFVVLHALIHVFVPPLEHAIDQEGELMSHGGNRFRCAESAAEAAILGAEVTLAPEERRGRQPQRGGGSIDHMAGASAPCLR